MELTAENAVQDRNMHTNWVFTLHYGGLGQPSFDVASGQLDAIQKQAKYLIVGDEIAPTTSQKHFQAYVQFMQRKRLSSVRKLSSTAHWEPAKGDGESNKAYCTKEKLHLEHGEMAETHPGKREKERYAQARAAAMRGDLDEIDDQLYIRHYSSFKSIQRDNLKPLPDATECTGLWVYGISGSGKSRWARAEFGTNPDDLYLKPINKWWDGYRRQPYVLLEDFGKEHSVLAYHLKIWADRYSFPAEVKGTTIVTRPQKLIVTSQYHPRDIWHDEETIEAILRRFKLKFVGDIENNPWQKNPWTSQLILPSPKKKASPRPLSPSRASVPSALETSQCLAPSPCTPPRKTKDSKTILSPPTPPGAPPRLKTLRHYPTESPS